MIDDDLLIHTVQAKTITGKDADRNPVYSEGVTVRGRMISVKETSFTSLGAQKNDRMTLYVDCETEPLFEPQENMIIEWKGETYTVRRVQPCYALNVDVPHHYKAALV